MRVPLCYKQILASTWLQTESGDTHGAVGEGPFPWDLGWRWTAHEDVVGQSCPGTAQHVLSGPMASLRALLLMHQPGKPPEEPLRLVFSRPKSIELPHVSEDGRKDTAGQAVVASVGRPGSAEGLVNVPGTSGRPQWPGPQEPVGLPVSMPWHLSPAAVIPMVSRPGRGPSWWGSVVGGPSRILQTPSRTGQSWLRRDTHLLPPGHTGGPRP